MVRHKRYSYNGSIKAIWGIAKSKELQLDKEELYLIIMRETGKESIKELTQRQIDKICGVLAEMKDAVKKKKSKNRTDVGGSAETVDLRRKIYNLCEKLGWNDDNKRIDGFCYKMFGISSIKWLSLNECMKLIEILKKMVKRKEDEERQEEKDE